MVDAQRHIETKADRPQPRCSPPGRGVSRHAASYRSQGRPRAAASTCRPGQASIRALTPATQPAGPWTTEPGWGWGRIRRRQAEQACAARRQRGEALINTAPPGGRRHLPKSRRIDPHPTRRSAHNPGPASTTQRASIRRLGGYSPRGGLALRRLLTRGGLALRRLLTRTGRSLPGSSSVRGERQGRSPWPSGLPRGGRIQAFTELE